MDRVDKKILELLQKNAHITAAEIADAVGLSPSPCARRIKRLEQNGVIAGYHALIARERVGIAMTVFVEVSLNNHQVKSIDDFEQSILAMDEVVSCHVVSGAYDYLLEVVANDLVGYESFTRQLQRLQNVKDIHTHLAIRKVKNSHQVPIYGLNQK
ncbi:Lrp/AsnC family transcriptional regulator [Vibrio sp. IRLE0018]|uniref:Lrp/AsnC family transcriptional regulator n=1 Tax=Vibrio TaxID=662 RepID=UPI001594E5DC|nr:MULTISPECIES: Lrp/AsnC family transcriptional regulator [Vibrio]MCF8777566.1 Lrp/AsnC family transcriptional regulator [Vibrio floridensis]NVC61551.1 Lrp/AsnC family transcriptional regulator [Vibrio sp. 05-20-BW147]HAS6346706.1 winged helix-turn-helix transcriptional regulator [Vibrio vulnificus]